MGEYRKEAIEDAKEAARYFMNEIVEEILDENGTTDKLEISDYSDSYHYETHIDKSYRLKDAAELLDDLHEFEETDSKLWQELSPKDAIEAMAAYTYGNAVASMFKDLMDHVNDAIRDAEGDTLFWSTKDWVEGAATKTGVLDWLPTEKWDALSEEEQEELEEKYQTKLKDQVKKIVKEAIEGW